MKTSIELFKSKRFISKRKRCDWKWEIFSWVGSNRLLPKTIFFQNWNHTQYTLKVSFLWIYSLMSLNFVVVVPFCGSKARKIDQLYLICYMCMLNFGSEKASNMTLNYRTNEKKHNHVDDFQLCMASLIYLWLNFWKEKNPLPKIYSNHVWIDIWGRWYKCNFTLITRFSFDLFLFDVLIRQIGRWNVYRFKNALVTHVLNRFFDRLTINFHIGQ